MGGHTECDGRHRVTLLGRLWKFRPKSRFLSRNCTIHLSGACRWFVCYLLYGIRVSTAVAVLWLDGKIQLGGARVSHHATRMARNIEFGILCIP